MTSLLVGSPGLLATVQDLGRPGHAHFGVARSGAADRASLRRANRLVGNPESLAALEVLAGGLALEALGPVVVSVTGAVCDVLVNDRPHGRHAALALEPDDVLSLGPATRGVRVYVGIRGGLAVPEVLGSRAYDQLSDLGPAPLKAGDTLSVGDALATAPIWDPLPAADPPADPVLRITPGPRADWLTGAGLEQLGAGEWSVHPASDRTGVRLTGSSLRRREGELASEGVARGSVQVPPDGLPILLGPDAGVTGGYPVVAVVVDADIDLIGQLAPGTRVRFRPVPHQ